VYNKIMARKAKLMIQVLELLAMGTMLGFTKSKKERRKLFEESDRIWYSMDRKQLYQILERLKLRHAIQIIKCSDGIEAVQLTNLGKALSLSHQFRNMQLMPKRKWDKKWRFVLFDVPESKKKTRDALRRKLKHLGFLEFQKSVFIYPYPCREEINLVINFFDIAELVYYIEAPIIPDVIFRKHFKI